MATIACVLILFVAILRATNAGSAPCITVNLPDFLTTNKTKCSDVTPTDICAPFNENNTEKVRDVINCTTYDAEYKVIYLTAAMVDAVAATLPEELCNMSWAETEFIVRWCSNGYSLPKSQYGRTCEEYLSLVNVTCAEPTSLIVPDVNGLGECAKKNTIPDLCTRGDTLTWQAFTELIALIRCVYFAIIPLLPSEQY